MVGRVVYTPGYIGRHIERYPPWVYTLWYTLRYTLGIHPEVHP